MTFNNSNLRHQSLNGRTISEVKHMLDNMLFDKHIRPYEFIDRTSVIRINTWTDLSKVFVKWLIDNKLISDDKLPIDNSASNGKYFINLEPKHKIAEKDGLWHKVGPYSIDTKYNAMCHVRNIIFTLNHLNIYNPDFKISFRQN